jgi:uncharacterized protein (DUF2235 family)
LLINTGELKLKKQGGVSMKAKKIRPEKSKNIVLCSDGTGNSANKDRGTNVFKLYEAVDHANPKVTQFAYYDDGVGTSRLKPLMILGGAFGFGLGRNVRQLYTQLVQTYNPGDRIFLFGFSRGAFTVRELAGLINACGVLDRERTGDYANLRRHVKIAYRLYRSGARSLLGSLAYYLLVLPIGWMVLLVFPKYRSKTSAEAFRRAYGVKLNAKDREGRVPIAFLGCWDTVSAIGGPIDGMAKAYDWAFYRSSFSNYRLSSCVERARHALSLDDERQTFHPLMWDEAKEKTGRIKQVWFAGVHSNVGGGYAKQGMSLVALKWMMDEASGAGLRFIAHDQTLFASHADVHDKLFDSRSGWQTYYRYKPRDVHKICSKYRIDPAIHESVLDRIVHGTDGYAPGNLPRRLTFIRDRWPAGRLANAAKAINKAVGNRGSLLDDWWVRAWVWWRRLAHLLFVIASLALLLFVIGEDTSLAGIAEALKSLTSLGGILAAGAKLAKEPWVLILLVVTYFYGVLGKKSMTDHFYRFWFGLRKSLAK